jgi:hypothetical protein
MDTDTDPELDEPIRRHEDIPDPRKREVVPSQPVKVPEKEPA